ncbi:MAG TPA: helix-turn-helix domain-containing protein [Longimicrobium sp.]|nr:helix-turn-helix domain-containing protein [Longimicrobium sp.]
MGHLLFLSHDPAGAGALRRAVERDAAGGVFHTVQRAGGWAELAAWAAAPGGARLALVDPYFGGAFAAGELRRLRERAPALEVVALADFTGRPAADAFTLALLGVREIVCTSEADAAARVAAALEAHLGRGAMEAMVETLAAAVPGAVHRWLAPVLLSARGAATVPELARAALCSPRTLRRTLRGAGLPPPEELLAWRRLLHAVRLLDDGRSADSVARAMDFSTGSALRKCLKRHTGLRPGELLRHGGFAAVAALFLRRCGAAGEKGERGMDGRVRAGAGDGRSGHGTGRGAGGD